MVSPSVRLVLLLLAVGSLGMLIACSSSEPTTTPKETEESATGPALSLLYTTDDGTLALHDARAGETNRLATSVTSTGSRAVSPDERHLAVSYATADSTHLALLDRTSGTLQPVEARAGTATYSLAWHPSGDRLAFGVYEPAAQGTRGPGEIRVASLDGTHRSVGCSAAREVLDWLPSGTLATRNDDQLYLVAPSDCATRASADARRMHEATYAPTGTRLAYLHRELTYDQAAGDYTPDSTLVLSDPDGQNPTDVLGPSRRAHHLRWAPDGSELAVSVRTEQSGHRQIAVYRDSVARTVYLSPPAATTADQGHPRWSPDGNFVAFTQGHGANARAAVRVEGQTRRLGPVDEAVWGWTGPRTVVVPGPDSLRVQTLSGSTQFVRSAPETLLHVWQQSSP